MGGAFNLDPAAQLGCVGFDIDPVSDVIRVVTGINITFCPPRGGNNYTIIPDTAGVVNELPLAFNALDLNSGVTPDVEAAAYSNNVSSATTTTLFDIDLSTLFLVTQGDPNPNDGQLFTIGVLGAAFPAFPINVAFDISQSGKAFVSNSNGTTTSQFFTIDLTTGLLIFVGTIGSEPFITDISAAPANNSSGGGCAIGGPIQGKAGMANVLVLLIPAFVIGLRVVLWY